MRLTVFLLSVLALLLPGCCANNVCDCDDRRADALYFRFRASDGSGGSYRPAETDTLALLRYVADSVQVPGAAHDSLRVAYPVDSVLVIDNNAPFAPATGRKLNSFDYVIQPRDTSRRYVVRDIVLRGAFEGDGCCTCYQNTYKTAVVDYYEHGRLVRSQPYDATAPNNQAVVYELTK